MEPIEEAILAVYREMAESGRLNSAPEQMMSATA
jgi:hypothetical protein